MEYSPMLVIVLWALTPSDCFPMETINGTEEVAKVKEMPSPSMTIQNPGELTIPGYFTFNDGQPFLVEKDPLTGSLNFNIKTTPVKTQQHIFKSSDDYFYEDETGFGKDMIDRKDGDIYGLKAFGQNDIKDSSKGQEDLHKFLNLPVHYSTNGKFPLISSSYANTKVQGHGSSSYSNHKPYSTSTPSTVSPTYYTHKSQETTTTTTTRSVSSTTPSTTTTYRTTQSTTRPTTPSTTTSAYDYEYVDYDYDKYEHEPEASERPTLNFVPSGSPPITTFATSTPTTTIQSTTQPTTSTTFTTSRPPPTYYTEATTVAKTTQRVAIVTSLPIDPKDENDMNKTPLSIKLSTTTNRIDYSTVKNDSFEERKNASTPIDESASSVVVNVSQKPNLYVPDLEFGMRITTSGPHRGTNGNKTKIEPVGFGYGVPISNGAIPGMRPPPWGYGVPPFQPLGPGHSLPPKRPPPQINGEYKPNFEGNYVKPGKIVPSHPSGPPPHTFLTVGSNHPTYHYPPIMNKPPPSFFPEDQVHSSSINHQSFENAIKHKQPDNFNGDNFSIVVGNVPKYPPQKLNVSLPNPQDTRNPQDNRKPQDPSLEFNNKPPHPTKQPHPVFEAPNEHPGNQNPHLRPPLGFPENQQIPLEGFSLVPDNQYVKVSQDQANPSYSLQTSFSIGAPQYDEEKEAVRPMQGIGQVLFPDDEKVEGNKRPGTWPAQPSGPVGPHHQNPAVSHHQNPAVPHHQNPVVPHYQPGAGPNHQPGAGPNHQPGAGPNHQPGVGPNHQPGAGPNHQPGAGPNHQPGAGPHHQNGGRPPMPPSQSRPPQRYPPDLHPSAAEAYPRPPWESHPKHPYHFNQGQKKDPMNPPPNFLPPKRPKPQGNLQRPDLPNILPQFRPNAKVGEYHGPSHPNHPPYVNPAKVREPFDTLQPPPLPRPQFLRHHGNEESHLEQKMDKKEQLPVHLPLVHKRMTGPQSGSRVTPLGLIQSNLPPRNAMLRNDYKDYDKKNKDEPVFVVYPSNGGNKANGHSEGMVVVGTRGSQRPLPPDNLGLEDDLDSFPLDDNNNFPIPGRDRIDTPILKSKSTPKPQHKPEFLYSVVKPGSNEPQAKIITAGTVDIKKEYTAYSPTISASTEEMLLKEHDSEINLIPYLQDYMPYATKKPLPKPIEAPGWKVEDKSTLKPISVTLNTMLGSTNKPIKNHLIVTEKTDSEPERQDFLAPFHASLSEPSQGWSVVTQNTAQPSDKVSTEHTTAKPTEPSKFDIDNFKPELLSGFKPILPPKFDDDRPTTKAA